MRQLPAEETVVAPGDGWTWGLGFPQRPATPGGRPPTSYNQAAHLAAARLAHTAGEPIAFAICAAFELPGPVQLPLLEAALLSLVRRHEVLRTSCHPTPWGISLQVHQVQDVRLQRRSHSVPLESHAATRTHVNALLRQVNPVTGPLVAMGAVIRAHSATVHIVYDHLVADVLSAPLTVAELVTTYENLVRGRRPDSQPAASFLDFAREERACNHTLHASDERLAHWRTFISPETGFYPDFPLDLGADAHRRYPAVNHTHPLLPGPMTERLEAACRAHGGSVPSGLLAAMALSIRDEGGPDVYRAMMPVDRRRDSRYSRSVGWFVSAVPVEIPAPRTAGFAALLARARHGLEAGRAQAQVHHLRARQLLGDADTAATAYRAVSFFSYLDFRQVPGAGHPSMRAAAVHVWSPATTGSFFWFHRDHDGLHLNTLHPDTPQAHRTIGSLVTTLQGTLHAFTNQP
ncbi:condensation domain-containing protein [Streptomyces sp. Go40/10]|uniref:condensation domain-containing protein n=1 Tax=Streptomyces sp. Go40/10 TaxID=2825844 RepID=UPI001E5A06AC|nr:condensation domain-containing protein [Streptomyces sp. Go40/10]UFQ99921.1 condensation domain-containing protein [Streptomyces sp. Go40/10]